MLVCPGSSGSHVALCWSNCFAQVILGNKSQCQSLWIAHGSKGVPNPDTYGTYQKECFQVCLIFIDSSSCAFLLCSVGEPPFQYQSFARSSQLNLIWWHHTILGGHLLSSGETYLSLLLSSLNWQLCTIFKDCLIITSLVLQLLSHVVCRKTQCR